ncbi:MAG: class I SAM-dependent methyltransferase, partial [Geodermatophilaceae bacterium]|nr:class I SAM-dependent methyltransferase [Geodermatophilaceae bacterium]
LAAARPADVLDVGCGWGELLLRIAAAAPSASGSGVDTDERVLTRARAAAAERGLAERVGFLRRSADELDEPADLVVCVGSSHALAGGQPAALAGLLGLVRPGGQLLFGDGIWEPRGRVDEDLVYDDVLALPDLAGMVEAAIDAGFRPLYVETANHDEWDAFESGYLADDEEWLLTHAEHVDAARIRAAADEHRTRWLRGYRNGLGFAYLTLGRPAAAAVDASGPAPQMTRDH